MAKQFVNLAIGARGWPSVRTKLDGRIYKIEAVWVDGESLWAVNLYKSDGVLLRGGLVLRHREDVLAPFTGSEFPGDGLGKLVAWDTTKNQRDPGRRDLARGSDVRLVYITADDGGS